MRGGNGTARGEVRRRLNALGKRRKKREVEGDELTSDIKQALAVARVAGITMEEAAKRLGLNRTTIYQVYLADEKTPRSERPTTASTA